MTIGGAVLGAAGGAVSSAQKDKEDSDRQATKKKEKEAEEKEKIDWKKVLPWVIGGVVIVGTVIAIVMLKK